MLALISFFPSKAEGIGSMDLSKKIRQKLAKESHSWKCEQCSIENCKLLAPYEPSSSSSSSVNDSTDPKPQEEEKAKQEDESEIVKESEIEQSNEESKQPNTLATENDIIMENTSQQQEEQPQQEDASVHLVQRRHSTAPQTPQRRPRQRKIIAPLPYSFLAQTVNILIFLISIIISYILFDKMSE